jgi:hypothetical protein
MEREWKNLELWGKLNKALFGLADPEMFVWFALSVYAVRHQKILFSNFRKPILRIISFRGKTADERMRNEPMLNEVNPHTKHVINLSWFLESNFV